MGLVIGMDEAGYGPNLGPLVVTATVWEVPGSPSETDFWSDLSEIVTRSPLRNDWRLHIADSKAVYTPRRGLGSLERSVVAALRLGGECPTGFRALWRALVSEPESFPEAEPWFAADDLTLPHEIHTVPFDDIAARFGACCRQYGIRLKVIRSDIVLTERFNRLTRASNSKGLTLSRLSLRLLQQVWDPDDPQPTLIVADKHGGRNRYDQLLSEVLDGRMLFRLHESTSRSSYRVGGTDLHFETGAESHFPVAVASMVCKYVRELAMILFNRYWCARIPGLKQTKGYPTDARRFRQEIAEMQARLGIADDVLWRQR